MIRPLLVEKGSKQAVTAIGAFAAGAVIASASVGLACGSLGLLLPHMREELVGVSAAGIGTFLGILDLAGKTPTTRRQTKWKWMARRSFPHGAFLWGLDLGVGATSVRIASLYWAVLVTLLLLSSPALGALALSLYGVGLAISLAAGTFLLPRLSDVRPNVWVIAFASVIRSSLAALLLGWSLFLAIAATALST